MKTKHLILSLALLVLSSALVTAGTTNFTDPAATTTRSFYRVQQQ